MDGYSINENLLSKKQNSTESYLKENKFNPPLLAKKTQSHNEKIPTKLIRIPMHTPLINSNESKSSKYLNSVSMHSNDFIEDEVIERGAVTKTFTI